MKRSNDQPQGDSPRLWHGTGRYRVAADLINKAALRTAKILAPAFNSLNQQALKATA